MALTCLTFDALSVDSAFESGACLIESHAVQHEGQVQGDDGQIRCGCEEQQICTRKPSLLLRLTALTHCSIIHNAVFCVMGLANSVEAFRYGIAQKHQRKKSRP